MNPPAQLDCNSAALASMLSDKPATLNDVKGKWIYAMMDSGANCDLSVVPNMCRYAAPGTYTQCGGQIGGQGKGQSTTVLGRAPLPFYFETGKPHELPRVYDSPQSRKMLIDQIKLHIDFGIKVDVDRKVLTFTDGSPDVPLYNRGDHRLWVAIFMPVHDESVTSDGSESTFGDAGMQGIDANSADIAIPEGDDGFIPDACPA